MGFTVRILPILIFLFCANVLLAAGESVQSFILDGRLFDGPSSTDPLLDNSVLLNIKILNPAGTCLLYEEQQTIDTSVSDGFFNIKVGSSVGAAKRTGDDPNLSMATIFQNESSIAANNPGCLTGYNPASGLRPTASPTRAIYYAGDTDKEFVADTGADRDGGGNLLCNNRSIQELCDMGFCFQY